MRTASAAFLLALATLLSMVFVGSSKAATTTIRVDPLIQDAVLGESFVVNVNLDSAQDLFGYDISMSFSSGLLNANSIEYEGYLNEPTAFIPPPEVNNSGGYVRLVVLSLVPASPKTGGSPPPLASVNFTVIGVGVSSLHLFNTKLANSTASPIPHETIDSQVSCYEIPEFASDIILPVFLIITVFATIVAWKHAGKLSEC
jgi:hypothetical protein